MWAAMPMALLRQALAGVSAGLLICSAGILSTYSMADLDTAAIRQQVRSACGEMHRWRWWCWGCD